MTPKGDAGHRSVAGRWLAFYRLQARLMWDWRPTRLAILRRAILSYLGACLALAITAGVAPGLQVAGLGPLLLAALCAAPPARVGHAEVRMGECVYDAERGQLRRLVLVVAGDEREVRAVAGQPGLPAVADRCPNAAADLVPNHDCGAVGPGLVAGSIRGAIVYNDNLLGAGFRQVRTAHPLQNLIE